MEKCGASERGVATGVGGTASKRMGATTADDGELSGSRAVSAQTKNVTLAVALDSTLTA
jgi:hypothetical protein